MGEIVLAFNAIKDALERDANYKHMDDNARKILNANLAELSDLMVRYAKENYDS